MLVRAAPVLATLDDGSASNPAFAGEFVAGAVAGSSADPAMAQGAIVADEHAEALHECIVRENHPSCACTGQVILGGPLPPSLCDSSRLPDGVSRYHYVFDNEGPVIIHPETGRIIQVHDY